MLYITGINYYLLLVYIITICIAWTIDSCSVLVLEKYDVSSRKCNNYLKKNYTIKSYYKYNYNTNDG